MPYRSTLSLIAFLLLIFSSEKIHAQDCRFVDTAVNIDFGNSTRVQEFTLGNLRNYKKITGTCPNDGMFTYVSSTENCYDDHWHTLPIDHTPGDVGGKMMLINASYETGMFFNLSLSGLQPNTPYEVGLWLLNICKINSECSNSLPDILVKVLRPDNSVVTQFRTSGLTQTSLPVWKHFASLFTTPADATSFNLVLYNLAPGGCGNDFAIDDITIRQCYPIVPEQKPAAPKQSTTPISRQPDVPKKEDLVTLKRNTAPVNTIQPKAINVEPKEIKNSGVTPKIPDQIRNRENLIAKKITVAEGELKIELYDNGTIDGDTVSIYHNNELIVSRAGLSEKPIIIKLKIAKDDPHHELTMVAENLGSIPPNTSLMVVTSKDKRDEIFISSTKQQNARLIIDLKE